MQAKEMDYLPCRYGVHETSTNGSGPQITYIVPVEIQSLQCLVLAARAKNMRIIHHK
jgi:hypothetical protein